MQRSWILWLAALCIASATPAQAQERGPLKIILGFGAGGPPDVVARKIGARLAEQLQRPVVVENRPGASGTLGASAVARAAADGDTLLFGVAANLAVAPAVMRSPPYDAAREFTPIIEVARGAYVLLVRSDAPARDVAGLAAWARDNPGKLNYATPGLGSVHHMATEMLRRQLGLDLVHVPYRTNLYQALLAGEVQLMFESLPGPLPFLQSGKLRAIAVTGPHRLERLPDVPTLAEAGVPGFDDVQSWWGFVAPAGLAPAKAAALNASIRDALADADLRRTMRDWGITLSPGTPEAFGSLIAQEGRRWKEEVQRLAIPLQ